MAIGCSPCGPCSGGDDDEHAQKFEKGGKNDLSEGPLARNQRGCTDCWCFLVFVFAQVVFWICTCSSAKVGNPTKLYKPRDYSGGYCGVADNWQTAQAKDTQSFEYGAFTMNTSAVLAEPMRLLMCSAEAQKALTQGDSTNPALLTTQEEKNDYLCNCCLVPCGKCSASPEAEVAVSGQTSVSAMLSELADTTSLGALYSSLGANAGKFTSGSFWKRSAETLNEVCLSSCEVGSPASDWRNYSYSPSPDTDLYGAWKTLSESANTALTSDIKSVMQRNFTLKAMPETECPYSSERCVPMPGLQMEETVPGSNFCNFGLSSEAASAVGDAAAATLESIGAGALADAASASFGQLIGEFQQSLDTFFIVCTLAFVFGFIFLIVLRFTASVCVWLAVFSTVLLFALGGGMAFAASGQCQGAGLFETGRQVSYSALGSAENTMNNMVYMTPIASETMTGNGADYRGSQSRSVNGVQCLDWATQQVLPAYTPTNFPSADLVSNYCRNPTADDVDPANTIWCVVPSGWDTCAPIGVMQPECAAGYAIKSGTMRDMLYVLSFVIWGLCIVWIITICCLLGRIRLAIALNKVAAQFLASEPTILLAPVVQAFAAILWTTAWLYAASFLLSQVPEDYTPSGYFTYQEAAGTATTPGACNGAWPEGFAWKDETCQVLAEGSGMAADTAKCWRCGQPRYMLDIRFFLSLFIGLWNNAFNIALGQMVIAMAVSLWFFKKGSGFQVTDDAVRTVSRYHLGSVALGSFLLATLQFIRYLMMYFEKNAQAQKNRVMVVVLKCLQCYFWCLEKLLKFLNKNAYIQVALCGTPFLASAKKAFHLILRNLLRFGALAMLSGFVHFIAFVCIVTSTVASGYLILGAMHPEITPVMPLICYGMVSYVVAALFMNVFGLAVDTSLQCFLATEEMGISEGLVPSVLQNLVAETSKEKTPSGKE